MRAKLSPVYWLDAGTSLLRMLPCRLVPAACIHYGNYGLQCRVGLRARQCYTGNWMLASGLPAPASVLGASVWRPVTWSPAGARSWARACWWQLSITNCHELAHYIMGKIVQSRTEQNITLLKH